MWEENDRNDRNDRNDHASLVSTPAQVSSKIVNMYLKRSRERCFFPNSRVTPMGSADILPLIHCPVLTCVARQPSGGIGKGGGGGGKAPSTRNSD